jgi:hypothetical protein
VSAVADEDLLYRFTVRTDRSGNSLVEKMAKKAGLSPTSFVQRHFEQLFETTAHKPKTAGDPDQPAPPAPPPDRSRIRMKAPARLLLDTLKEAADDTGFVEVTLREIGDRCGGYSANWAQIHVGTLVDTHKLRVDRRGARGLPTRYQILEEAAA